MPAKQLRCENYVIRDGDVTGENAIECGAVALACADCGESAGCEEHGQRCPRCGEALCESCSDRHACSVIYGGAAA